MSDFGPPDNAGWLVPELDGNKNGSGRSNNGEAEEQHGINDKAQGNAVIEHALVFKVLDFTFRPAGFETRGAEMLSLKLAIAKGAEKTSAGVTRLNGAFLWMKEAA